MRTCIEKITPNSQPVHPYDREDSWKTASPNPNVFTRTTGNIHGKQPHQTPTCSPVRPGIFMENKPTQPPTYSPVRQRKFMENKPTQPPTCSPVRQRKFMENNLTQPVYPYDREDSWKTTPPNPQPVHPYDREYSWKTIPIYFREGAAIEVTKIGVSHAPSSYYALTQCLENKNDSMLV